MKMESISCIKTLLHPKIADLYKINPTNSNSINFGYINRDGTYNWKCIEALLFSNEQNFQDTIYPKTYDEYFPYVQRLQPVLQQSESILAGISNNSDWLNKLKWLGQESRVPLILNEHNNPSSMVSTLENVLFMTAALENALANVYLTITKKSPPHLLRDLLDTNDLRDILGECPVFFCKVLMGSAKSINLRNIAWHGFPLPNEVPRCFVSTLFIASASLSELIKHLTLTSRPQVNDFSRFLSKIYATQIDFALVDNFTQVMAAIDSSRWTGEWAIFWKQLYQHYKQQSYWRCIILILPQIELVLRKMYGEVNNFDITAKLNEYYITMNSIFESSDNNRLIDGYMPKGTLHFLYDIFISPFGMRIRDKVSHGEVDLDCVDKKLCSVLLYAGLNLINKETFPLDGYETRFHLNFMVYEALTASQRFVLKLMNMTTPKGFGMEFEWSPKVILSLQELGITESFEIIHRSKGEPEIMTNLMKIAQLVVQICENYQISFEERFGMFLNHELRSRARKTLEKMVQSLNIVTEILASIVVYLFKIVNQKFFANKFEDCQKFCRQTLTIVENLSRYSKRESNEWLKAVECCNKFQNNVKFQEF